MTRHATSSTRAAGVASLRQLEFNCLSLLALLGPPGCQAALGAVKGPAVAVEEARSADVRYTDERADAPAPDLTVKRRRYEANLLAPLPVGVLGGMFVLKADFFKERRTLAGEDAGPQANDARDPGVAGIGAVFLPHAKEGAPRFFILAARYGEMSLSDRAGPMSEYVLGADTDAEDMPWRLTFDATDDATTRILVRYRRFPGFHRWLLLVGHRIERRSGWSFDVTIPSHLLVGWQTGDAAWKLYGGVKWVSREYPIDTETAAGWTEGFVTTQFAAVRRELAAPLYLALEAGMQKESLTLIDADGETVGSQTTALAPWARLALETWLATP